MGEEFTAPITTDPGANDQDSDQIDHPPPTILAGTTNPQFSWSVVVWLAILALAALAALFIVAWRNGLDGVANLGG